MQAMQPRMETGTVTAKDLLTLFETAVYPDAEARIDGTWRPIAQVCTDYNDDTVPIFLDLTKPAERRLLTGTDEVEVRGLAT